MKILVLDNYDSFTYNLVHYVEDISGQKVDVFRNDKITLDEVDAYDAIILSPGPGLPSAAGIMPELIKRYSPTKKILGICLGHQAIAESFGGSLYNLEQVYHGIATSVSIDPLHKIFSGMDSMVNVGRYHSWAVNNKDLPKCFSVIARDQNGVIMGIKHESFDLTGVQFHPESILTPSGHEMIRKWLS